MTSIMETIWSGWLSIELSICFGSFRLFPDARLERRLETVLGEWVTISRPLTPPDTLTRVGPGPRDLHQQLPQVCITVTMNNATSGIIAIWISQLSIQFSVELSANTYHQWYHKEIIQFAASSIILEYKNITVIRMLVIRTENCER